MKGQTQGAATTEEDDLRAKAVKRIKPKRDFIGHVVTFLVINAGL